MTHPKGKPQEPAERLLRVLLQIREGIDTLLQPPQSEGRPTDLELLSGRQAHALYIVHARPTTMGELALAIGMTPSAATTVADRLVALNMADRVKDPADRRLVRLTTTERGAAVIRNRNRWEHTAIEALAKVMNPQAPGSERQGAEELLRLLEAATEEAGRAQPGSHAAGLAATAAK